MSGDGGMSVDHASGPSNRSSLTAGNDTSIRRDRHPRGALASWRVAIALPVNACDYSPTLDQLGSYLPARMLCAVIEFHRYEAGGRKWLQYALWRIS
jgi:hypothetical protein